MTDELNQDGRGQPATGRGDDRYELRRRKALQVLYELKFTFGMDELASEFLRCYIEKTCRSDAGLDGDLITERIVRRVA
jgi:hypothetical protein